MRLARAFAQFRMTMRGSLLLALSFALAACAAAPVPDDLQQWLQDAPPESAARLTLRDGAVAAAAVAIDPRNLPATVRTALEAVAPAGKMTFCGREWSSRGDGYRIDKDYTDQPEPHTRSLLLAANGQVLERSHSVGIADVPQHILATALQTGPRIDVAHIVSGPEHEEYWLVIVRDRSDRSYRLHIGLEGQELSRSRTSPSRIEY